MSSNEFPEAPSKLSDDNVQYGENPYFPQEPVAEEAPVPTEQASEQPAQPTFDAETDAAAGFDVNSPEYKHFQAAFTRARQADKAKLEESISERVTALEAQQLAAGQPEATGEPSPMNEDGIMRIPWDSYAIPELGDDSGLQGVESEISELIQDHIRHAIEKIAEQQMAALREQQVDQSVRVVADFITEVTNSDATKGEQVMSLLREYSDIAERDPQRWMQFARTSLGLSDTEKPAPAPAPSSPSPERLAAKQRAATPHSTAVPGSTFTPGQAVVPGANPKDRTRNAIAAALEAELARRSR